MIAVSDVSKYTDVGRLYCWQRKFFRLHEKAAAVQDAVKGNTPATPFWASQRMQRLPPHYAANTMHCEYQTVQKVIRVTACIKRPGADPVIRPKLEEDANVATFPGVVTVRAEPGALKLVWFITLNASMRS